MELILDTSIVVAAEREGKGGEDGPARRFLAKHLEAHFSITFTVLGELACGRSASPRQTWEQLTRPFSVISWTREVSWQYGEIYRVLRERGELIGANDLWIAATAITHGLPVVTGNLNEFRRVKNLEVVSF